MSLKDLQTYLIIGAGSNLGNKLFNLKEAKRMLSKFLGAPVTESQLIETEPWGNLNQESFYNQVWVFNLPDFESFELLEKLQHVEKALGRERIEKWGARTIDLDILYFGREVVKSESLKIPHPQIPNRRFWLFSLAELFPDEGNLHWGSNHELLLKNCSDSSWIKVISEGNL